VPVLILIGFLGGLVTGISPCILPVIPVIFAAGAVGGIEQVEEDEAADVAGQPGGAFEGRPTADAASAVDADRSDIGETGDEVLVGAGVGSVATGERTTTPRPASTPPAGGSVGSGSDPQAGPGRGGPLPGSAEHRRARRRPYAVVAGLVISFSFFTLVGTSLLSLLGLPQDLLRDIGLVVLVLVAVGLIVPSFGDLLERPFARMVRGQQHNQGGGFVLGISLGLLFVPCAGPVLTAITVVSANHRIGLSAIVLTVSFALGVAVPLLIFAIAGQRLGSRMKVVRTRAVVVRKVVGVLLILVALAIGLNWTSGLQRALPGYTDALQNHFESNAAARSALGGVTGNHDTGALATCINTPDSPVLARCGTAPTLTGIQQWLNTPGNRPLSLAGLKGKVVLVDFWTYSCINCQRTLPHLEAWNQRYAADGLTIIGVHTPEFAFEHVVSNVHAAAQQLGVKYPIAIDNNYATWDAYQNQYWPAEYLIDSTGVVRHVDYGEGGYGQTEGFIRQLLKVANPTVQLPPSTDVPDRTPTEQQLTPESYLGSQHPTNLDGQTILEGQDAPYTAPATVAQNTYAYEGRWNISSEASTSGTGASIELQYQAKDVYLVMGGSGTVAVSVNGTPTTTVTVSGVPKLYQLVDTAQSHTGLLKLSFSPGVAAYDFTFG
jgi:cytochrome c biogenesis protein CcdA/thiol-disulfide isomerase/thioredoxin